MVLYMPCVLLHYMRVTMFIGGLIVDGPFSRSTSKTCYSQPRAHYYHQIWDTLLSMLGHTLNGMACIFVIYASWICGCIEHKCEEIPPRRAVKARERKPFGIWSWPERNGSEKNKIKLSAKAFWKIVFLGHFVSWKQLILNKVVAARTTKLRHV